MKLKLKPKKEVAKENKLYYALFVEKKKPIAFLDVQKHKIKRITRGAVNFNK